MPAFRSARCPQLILVGGCGLAAAAGTALCLLPGSEAWLGPAPWVLCLIGAVYGATVGALVAGALWLGTGSATRSAAGRAWIGFVVGAAVPLMMAALLGGGRPEILTAFLPVVDASAVAAAALAATTAVVGRGR